jgi:hypothetical protein
MGRIREALSAGTFMATGGVVAPVRWESSAEKAAREQARLLEEQNDLLARIAQGSAPDPVSGFEQQAQDLATSEIDLADIADPMRSRVKRLRGWPAAWPRCGYGPG